MKRLLLPLACAAGLIALIALLPLFDPPQPRGISVTRAQVRAIADKAAREVGIEVDQSWVAVTWRPEPSLNDQFASDPGLRRRADLHPVVGPRIARFEVIYYRKGQPKDQPFGVVQVGRDGQVVGARRTPRPETAASAADPAELRRRADQFIATHKLPGAPNPVFESDRPTVLLKRTDHVFRYRVPSDFPSGNIVYFVAVSYIGGEYGGWSLQQEYKDGSRLEYTRDFIGGTIARIALLLGLLLVLLVIFLKKYHEGEVGIGVAGLLFAAMIVLAVVSGLLTKDEASAGTQLGALDGQRTALAEFAFAMLFVEIPLAVLVFLAWSVGESYTRERWGERLASFDAILRRDPVNATVGRSLLAGVLGAPIVAAASLGALAIPVVAGLARPALDYQPVAVAYTGGAWLAVINSATTAIVITVVCLLFILGSLRRRVSRPVALVIAIALGSLSGFGPALDSPLWSIVFGFGLVAAAAGICILYDLLAAATAIMGGSLLLTLVPFIRVAEGAARTEPLLALLLPLGGVLLLAISGLISGREIVYHYNDLAPHVRRIVERERVKAEIDAANRIQAALLPASDPELDGVSISSHYCAATEIGGDYFDFLHLPDSRVGVAFGDVAGHGLTSGIVMAMAKAALLVQVQYDASPTRVMEVLNENVMRTAPPRMMMTFFFGILDSDHHRMRFSSAGHLDPYVWRASTGRLECLSSWGFPLGVRRREPFREMAVQFQPGDRLVLYSDGLIEAVDDSGEPFGFDRFERVLESVADRPADEIKRAVLQSVKKFTNNRPPEDDQTLVVFSFEEHAQEMKLA